MSKITKCAYMELDVNDYSSEDVGSYYWFENVAHLSNELINEYENYTKLNNSIKNLYMNKYIPKEYRAVGNSSLIGISTVSNKPIMIVDVEKR